MKDVRHRMAEEHETHVAELLGGRKSRGSGSQWNRPMDGRQAHFESRFPLAWECKSTTFQSLAVSRPMWAKACEQAHRERPILPVRFYDSFPLLVPVLDLVVVGLDDFAEIVGAVGP